MATGIKKIVFLFLGWLSLFLGVIGIFLPILPTTPFALLAAYFFSKSSERLHEWLISQRTLGPMIVTWQRYGVIRPRAKWLATILMTLLFSYTLIFVQVTLWIKLIVATTGVSVLTFIWTRPSQIEEKENFML